MERREKYAKSQKDKRKEFLHRRRKKHDRPLIEYFVTQKALKRKRSKRTTFRRKQGRWTQKIREHKKMQGFR